MSQNQAMLILMLMLMLWRPRILPARNDYPHLRELNRLAWMRERGSSLISQRFSKQVDDVTMWVGLYDSSAHGTQTYKRTIKRSLSLPRNISARKASIDTLSHAGRPKFSSCIVIWGSVYLCKEGIRPMLIANVYSVFITCFTLQGRPSLGPASVS